MIGFIEVDAYCYLNRHATPPKHPNLAIMLLSNRYDGAPVEETKHVQALRKRPLAQRDDSLVGEEDSTVHHLVPIPEYLRQYGKKKGKKVRIIISMAPHLGVACAQSLLHLLITASQLAAMPMVANHLHYVVLSLGGTVELCMLSLCTRFEECSNCLRAIWYTRILPTPYYVVVSLDLERFHIIYYM